MALIAGGMLLCGSAPAAIGSSSPLLDQNAVVEPAAPAGNAPPTVTTPTATAPTTPTETAPTPLTVPAPAPPETLRTDPGAGNAAAQSLKSKRTEARGDCGPERPPINLMLAIGGIVAADERSSWTRLALFIAACFAAAGVIAFLARRGLARRSRAPIAPRGRLETVSVLVAIVGTLAAVADQLFTEPLPPEAAMTVRDVLPRITRGEYARRTGSDVSEVRKLDRREVGNVVLLEIRLKGYRGKRLDLQYATYSQDRNVRGTLLRGTDRTTGLRVADEDTQTSFVPIWVGYPKSERFEAQFRLIDDEQIRQLTATGPMRGSSYRYACSRDVRAV